MPRVVEPETLDRLAPHEPAAQRSRRDLLRVHRAMGTRGQLVRGWQALVSAERARAPLRVLELGAGDGRLLLRVARGLPPAWGPVHLTLLDRQPVVTPATLAAFADCGWQAQVQVADVLDWAAGPTAAAPRWDLISTTLFLHHFETRPLQQLLAAAAARCDRFFACEPRRSWRALLGSHLVAALGANAVTRADAVLSVRAGFSDGELAALWPRAAGHWRTQEQSAGPFSHCYSALRIGAAA